MIYTVTFNPALDYVISVDHFTPGEDQPDRIRKHDLRGKRDQCIGSFSKSGL